VTAGVVFIVVVAAELALLGRQAAGKVGAAAPVVVVAVVVGLPVVEVAVGVVVAVWAFAALDVRLTVMVAAESSVMIVRRMPRRTLLCRAATMARGTFGRANPPLGGPQGPSVSSVALT
jgi:hypothetical protein